MIPETGQSVLPKDPNYPQSQLPHLLGNNSHLQEEWNTFFGSFSQLSKDEIANRSQDIMRFFKENGVTYNIYGDPNGLNRVTTFTYDLSSGRHGEGRLVRTDFEDSSYVTLSYDELNRRANQVAHYLRALDVKPKGLSGSSPRKPSGAMSR